MTAPIIPADQWPEGAYMHTWDSNGLGNWHRTTYGAWHHWASDIPLPAGHDWRVPVMRQAAPAAVIVTVGGIGEPLQPGIDLEQIRVLAQGAMDTLTQNKTFPADVAAAVGHMRHLMALIEGQANVRSSSEQCSEAVSKGEGE